MTSNHKGLFLLCLLLACFAMSGNASADEIRPALLEITERDGGWVDVVWKKPALGDRVLRLEPVFPEFFEQAAPISGRALGGGWVEYRSYRTGGQALAGETIRIEGLAGVSLCVSDQPIFESGVPATIAIERSKGIVEPVRAELCGGCRRQAQRERESEDGKNRSHV